MTSMVCPDMVVTMSPGRCALPSGMFSTRPMAPTALTLALRAASACMRPTTQAAPAMSPFISSMPDAGLIDMPPVSKHTPLPMKATGAAPRLPPFQRMTTTFDSCTEPWPTPSSAPMPSFFMAATSSTSTPQPGTEHQVGDLIALERARGEFGKDRGLRGHRRHLAHGNAAELDHILAFELAVLAGPDHDEPRQLELRGRHDVERRAVLAVEAIRRRRPAHQIANRRQCALGCGAEFEVFPTEHNENTAQAAKGGEAELGGVGHGSVLPDRSE